MANEQGTVGRINESRPVVERSVALREIDWIEPVSVFASLKGRGGLIWLDSGMDPERLGRWSYLMWDPFASFEGAGTEYTLTQGAETRTVHGDPFTIVKDILAGHSAEDNHDWPPFTGGAAGFFGYGLLSHCEPSTKLVKTAKSGEGDIWLGFYDRLIAFDNAAKKTFIVVNLESGRNPGPELDTLNRLVDKIRKSPPDTVRTAAARKVRLKSNFSKEEYFKAVERIRSYIEAGDCYQVNIAQRFTVDDVFDPAALYLRLRAISPAPFAAYIDTGAAQILSTSPERFIKLRGQSAQTRPVKGTRPRGLNEEEDARLAGELARSEKDRAENVMIVDLLRNDLSKACVPNSVRVTELCVVEKFPTVYHLVSTIEGEVKPRCGAVDLLRMAFPGGSVTGAPKIRAMEIIDELEPDPRGAYCGAIGHIGFNGSMDTSIVIRTIVRARGVVKFHAGGGITYLSQARAEYDETMDKARALIEAVTK